MIYNRNETQRFCWFFRSSERGWLDWPNYRQVVVVVVEIVALTYFHFWLSFNLLEARKRWNELEVALSTQSLGEAGLPEWNWLINKCICREVDRFTIGGFDWLHHRGGESRFCQGIYLVQSRFQYNSIMLMFWLMVIRFLQLCQTIWNVLSKNRLLSNHLQLPIKLEDHRKKPQK